MIGIKKNVIIVNMGIVDLVMFNPVLLKKSGPYETEEGCLSLTGVRKTTKIQRNRSGVQRYEAGQCAARNSVVGRHKSVSMRWIIGKRNYYLVQ